MEPDSLSAESAFPPPPPLLPPPAPPPVASPSAINQGGPAVSLWRWNDRLALVIGGLTLFLLGIVTARVLLPDTMNDGNGGEPAVAVTPASPAAGTCEEEVNPPEFVASTEPAEPIANAEISTPAAEATPIVASEPPPTPSPPPPSEETAAATSPNAEAGLISSIAAPAVTPQTSPVSIDSIDGKVPTIKPLPSTQVCEPAKKFQDRKLSTALTWAESVNEASQQAEQDEKLVFLIHVSGNFEMPGFT